jgi:hypothetical protein
MRRTISLRVELAGMRKDVALASQQFEVSERRACKLFGMDRGSYRHEPRPDRNGPLREALVSLARQKPRGTDIGGCMRCWNGANIQPA